MNDHDFRWQIEGSVSILVYNASYTLVPSRSTFHLNELDLDKVASNAIIHSGDSSISHAGHSALQLDTYC